MISMLSVENELNVKKSSVAVPFGVHTRFLVGKLLIYGEDFRWKLTNLLTKILCSR